MCDATRVPPSFVCVSPGLGKRAVAKHQLHENGDEDTDAENAGPGSPTTSLRNRQGDQPFHDKLSLTGVVNMARHKRLLRAWCRRLVPDDRGALDLGNADLWRDFCRAIGEATPFTRSRTPKSRYDFKNNFSKKALNLPPIHPAPALVNDRPARISLAQPLRSRAPPAVEGNPPFAGKLVELHHSAQQSSHEHRNAAVEAGADRPEPGTEEQRISYNLHEPAHALRAGYVFPPRRISTEGENPLPKHRDHKHLGPAHRRSSATAFAGGQRGAVPRKRSKVARTHARTKLAVPSRRRPVLTSLWANTVAYRRAALAQSLLLSAGSGPGKKKTRGLRPAGRLRERAPASATAAQRGQCSTESSARPHKWHLPAV